MAKNESAQAGRVGAYRNGIRCELIAHHDHSQCTIPRAIPRASASAAPRTFTMDHWW